MGEREERKVRIAEKAAVGRIHKTVELELVMKVSSSSEIKKGAEKCVKSLPERIESYII